MIDKASVFAERFKSNPQVLQATVLGQGPDPNLDPYTALRALQLIKESNAMQMAQQAQGPTSAPSLASQAVAPQGLTGMLPMGAPAGQMPQAPQAPDMQASGGLADLPTPEEEYAEGGIVAFSGDEDENDAETGQLTRSMPVGRGDLPTYGAAMTGLQDLYKRFKDDKGYSPLTPDEEAVMYERSTSRGKAIYGDVLDKIKANIESERGLGKQNLRQASGLAALKAAAAMLEPGGFARGLGRAGSAFSDVYGRALEADAAQKRALTSMELNMAKAEADQRMGLHERAEARIAKANADRRTAYNAKVTRDKAEADLLYKMGRVSMPPAPEKPKGSGAPKLSPTERITLKAEAIANGTDKFMGKTGPEAADAYLESISKSGAAHTGVRFTGPDKTFDRQVKLRELYGKDPQLKSLADSLALAQLGTDQERIDRLKTAISEREKALEKTLPEVPTSGKSTPTPKPTTQSTAPTLEQFMKAARAAPQNKGISDEELRAYYQSTYGRK